MEHDATVRQRTQLYLPLHPGLHLSDHDAKANAGMGMRLAEFP